MEEGKALEEFSERQKKILAMKAMPYTLINRLLYRLGVDDILRRRVLDQEKVGIMEEARSGPAGGHFQTDTTSKKILQVGLWWPKMNKDVLEFISKCDICQCMGRPLKHNHMPLIPINPSQMFEMWAIDLSVLFRYLVEGLVPATLLQPLSMLQNGQKQKQSRHARVK